MQRIKMRLSSVTRNLSKFIDLKSMKILDNYAQYNPSPLTMQQMLEFGQTATEVESYQFLKREVPVRLSNIMKEVNLLPSSLLQMPSILLLQVSFAYNLPKNTLLIISKFSKYYQYVYDFESFCKEWYAQSFKDLCQFEEKPGDKETLAAFCQTLQNITTRHENVVQTMAQGVLELKDSHSVDIQTEMSIQYFLDRFYMSRIR